MKTFVAHLGSCLIIVAGLFFSCTETDLVCKEGKENLITQERTVTTFSAIESHGNFSVYLFQDSELDSPTVEVIAQENIIDLVQTQVVGSTLLIQSSECIQTDSSMVVNVRLPKLSKAALLGSGNLILQTPIISSANLELFLSGSGDLRSIETITAPTCKLTLTGTGNADLSISASTKLIALIDGSGTSYLRGATPTAGLYLNGSGTINAFELITQTSSAEIIGQGTINLFATDSVQARISGSGNIRIKGGAGVFASVTGSGKVENVD